MSNKALLGILAVIVVLIGVSAYAFSNMNNDSGQNQDTTKEQTNSSQNGYSQDGSPTPTATPSQAAATPAPPTSDSSVVELTVKGYGTIKIQLDEADAPKTSANFEKLVKEGFYNNLTFHRIIPGFVAQGGDPEGTGMGGPGYTVPAEIKLPHKRGSIAMARLGDEVNPNRESSGSQFYIALQDLPQLDGQYTVFGQVIEGMDVVDKIAAVKTDASDKPVTPVVIESAKLIK